MSGRWLAWATALALLAGATAGAVAGATAALILGGDDSGGATATAWPDVSQVAARALPAVVTILAEHEESQDRFGRVVQELSLGSGV
ncbi:MAG TPA: hypothetical protein VJA25_09780, partial [Dehalococcoidia bacterium]|nr:hypothetical protein [Dehalococcoidia bacterium]